MHLFTKQYNNTLIRIIQKIVRTMSQYLSSSSSKVQRVEKLMKSPRREAINKELDQHTHRIKELMHQDYIILEEENYQLKIKCKKVNELEEKVELVLRTNEELFLENEKLGKLVQEKMQECETLKRKVDTKRDGVADYQRKKLMLEKMELEKSIAEVEHLKNLTIKQIKTKHLIQIDTLQKDHEAGIKYYDDQLIKMKDQSDKKDIEINILHNKLRKFESQAQHDLMKSKDEILRLQDDITKLKDENRRLEAFVGFYHNSQDELEKAKEEITKLEGYVRQYDNSKEELSTIKQDVKRLEPYIRLYENTKEELAKAKEEGKRLETYVRLFENSQEELSKMKEEVKRLEPYIRLYDSSKETSEILRKQNEKMRDEKKKQQENSSRLLDTLQKLKQDHQKLRKQTKEQIEILQQQKSSVIAKNSFNEKTQQEQFQKLQECQKSLEQALSQQQKAKRDCEILHKQIRELDKINDKELVAIEKKYQALQMEEVSQMQRQYDKYRGYAEEEIAKLVETIRIREEEIMMMGQEKERIKLACIEDANIMKNQLLILQQEFRESELMHADERNKLEQEYRITMRNSEAQFMDSFRRAQAESQSKVQRTQQQVSTRLKKYQTELLSIQNDRRRISQDLHKKNIESIAYKQIIENQKQEIKEIQRKSEEKENSIRKEVENLKLEISMQQDKMKSVAEDWHRDKLKMEKEFKDMIAERNRTIEKIQRENESFKDFIGNRDKSLSELHEKIQFLSRQIQDRNNIIDSLRVQITETVQKNRQKQSQLKQSLTSHFSHQLNLLREDNNTRTLLLEAKIEELTILLKRKEQEIEDLLRQYKKLRDQMMVLAEQQANKKDMTLKFPGATPDLIATKNMFDVFVKTRVFDSCREVIGETLEGRENIHP